MQRSHHSSNICTWQLTDGIKDTCSASVTNIVDTLSCRSSQDTVSEMIKDSPARNESECLGPGATLTQDETDTQRGNEGVLSAVTTVSQSGRTRIRHLRPLRSLLNCCIIRAQATVTHSRFGKVASLRPTVPFLSICPPLLRSLQGCDVRAPLGRLPVLAGERGGLDGAHPLPRLAPLRPGRHGGHAGLREGRNQG